MSKQQKLSLKSIVAASVPAPAEADMMRSNGPARRGGAKNAQGTGQAALRIPRAAGVRPIAGHRLFGADQDSSADAGSARSAFQATGGPPDQGARKTRLSLRHKLFISKA